MLCSLGAACTTIPAQPPSALAARSIAQLPARQAVTTAHPLATRAALDILELGGSATDAVIAAQMVLGLVEPQSSGIGGGALVLLWDAAKASLTSFDGLAAAPARTTDALTIDVDGSTLKGADVRRGGRAVGVPGTLAVLKMIHETYGKLPWATLFVSAIDLAERGFPMPRYLHSVLSTPGAAADHPDMLPYYFGTDGKVRPVGSSITNPAYASTLRRIAAQGAAGLWRDGAGAALVAAAQRGARPSLMTEDDLAAYRALQRDPLCAPFLEYSVCVMAPPSFGGVVVLQLLQMLEARIASANKRFDFDDADFVHYFAEAGRFAQADRRHYVGDPGLAAVPARALVAPGYVRERALQIDRSQRRKDVAPGVVAADAGGQNESAPGAASADATSQMAIADRAGNLVSMTTTINLNFGSRLTRL